MPSTADSDRLWKYVNKTVPFRYNGITFSFQLSHALFSSFDIDDGSRLLLKSLAEQVPLADVHAILDVGCGVGVLGVCVGAHAPHAEILMQDRDALAAGFAARNAALNGLDRAEAKAGLAFQGLGDRRFDLLLSNIPAKAGAPVIESFFLQAAGRLPARGLAAFVIVTPLADLARSAAARAGLEIFWTGQTPRYCVMHLRRRGRGVGAAASAAQTGAPAADMSPYIRACSPWSFAGTSYEAETAYSLPDFDTPGYSLLNALTLLSETSVRGRVLVWNPGQGHLPVFLARRKGNAISALSIAGHDTLELAITERNLRSSGMPPHDIRPLPAEAALAFWGEQGSVDLLCANPVSVPRVPWQADLLGAARVLLAPRGRLLVCSTSTETQRLLASRGGFRPMAGKKRAGYRAVLLERL